MACKSIIAHIQAQAEKVIAQNEKLENDLGALVQERNELKAQLHNQQEEIMTLKAEIQRLRLAESLSGNSADNSPIMPIPSGYPHLRNSIGSPLPRIPQVKTVFPSCSINVYGYRCSNTSRKRSDRSDAFPR